MNTQSLVAIDFDSEVNSSIIKSTDVNIIEDNDEEGLFNRINLEDCDRIHDENQPLLSADHHEFHDHGPIYNQFPSKYHYLIIIVISSNVTSNAN